MTSWIDFSSANLFVLFRHEKETKHHLRPLNRMINIISSNPFLIQMYVFLKSCHLEAKAFFQIGLTALCNDKDKRRLFPCPLLRKEMNNGWLISVPLLFTPPLHLYPSTNQLFLLLNKCLWNDSLKLCWHAFISLSLSLSISYLFFSGPSFCFAFCSSPYLLLPTPTYPYRVCLP